MNLRLMLSSGRQELRVERLTERPRATVMATLDGAMARAAQAFASLADGADFVGRRAEWRAATRVGSSRSGSPCTKLRDRLAEGPAGGRAMRP
jgi:hypothetical protein